MSQSLCIIRVRAGERVRSCALARVYLLVTRRAHTNKRLPRLPRRRRRRRPPRKIHGILYCVRRTHPVGSRLRCRRHRRRLSSCGPRSGTTTATRLVCRAHPPPHACQNRNTVVWWFGFPWLSSASCTYGGYRRGTCDRAAVVVLVEETDSGFNRTHRPEKNRNQGYDTVC